MREALLRARLDLRAATRSLAYSAVGLGFVLVALGFFTVALWVWLDSSHGPLVAALIVGAAYLAVGLVLFAMAARRRRVPAEPVAAPAQPPPPPEQPRGSVTTLMEGFLLGIEAGRAARNFRRR